MHHQKKLRRHDDFAVPVNDAAPCHLMSFNLCLKYIFYYFILCKLMFLDEIIKEILSVLKTLNVNLDFLHLKTRFLKCNTVFWAGISVSGMI